jgi:hypothetical protein
MEHWKALLTVASILGQYCFSVFYSTSYHTQWSVIIVYYNITSDNVLSNWLTSQVIFFDKLFYYIMILFKQFYWLSCCHLTFRKIWYCLIKTRIDLVSLSFSDEIYKKNHVNSISIRPMDIQVMWNFVQSEWSY